MVGTQRGEGGGAHVVLLLVNFNSFSLLRISLDANLCALAGRTELLSMPVVTSSKPSSALQFDLVVLSP